MENGRRCRRNAIGKTELCGAHASVVESEIEESTSPIADLIDRFIHGEPIPKATIEQMVADAVSNMVGRTVTVDELKRQGAQMGVDVDGIDIDLTWDNVRFRVSDLYSRVSSRVRGVNASSSPSHDKAQREAERARRRAEQEAERQANARARERAGQVSRARRILGFTAKEPVTKDQVKQRQRELARKHHPDRGGSVERMQDINWAVDILLGPA